VVGQIERVARSEDGLIDHLATRQDARIHGDLFIDCTGPSGQLCVEAPREDWAHWLACDRIVISPKLTRDAPASYAHVAAHPAGWQRFTALQSKTEEVFAFNAAAIAAAAPEGALPFSPGRLAEPWQGNRLAMAGAAAVVDSLLNPQLELAVAAITRLITLLPATRACRAEAHEYNRQTVAELDSARDVAAAAYALNTRAEPFWDAGRAHVPPKRLAYKIALYQSGGKIALYDDEIFEESDWVALFEALGLRARHYDAQANALGIGDIEAHFARVRQVMIEAVGALPPHHAFLRSLG